MVSLIIPAYNESAVIARFLRAVLTPTLPHGLEVIVVCNGCTDDTAAVARQFGAPVRVIETDIAGKTHALNLGDQAASGFPRIYADADVLISSQVIRALVDRLQRGDVLAVAPSPAIDLTGCSPFVRAFYEVRARLPSAREGIGGSGVYALSEAGRRRFGEFPNVIADDGYVRLQFKRQERETLKDAHSVVFAPKTVRDLLRVRIRTYAGTIELARHFPDLWANRGESNHGAVVRLLGSLRLWPKLLVYYYVNIIARWQALGPFRSRSARWERDNTSRKMATETGG
jgi:glycosyltransferase involved in cell wall biosynthesis